MKRSVSVITKLHERAAALTEENAHETFFGSYIDGINIQLFENMLLTFNDDGPIMLEKLNPPSLINKISRKDLGKYLVWGKTRDWTTKNNSKMVLSMKDNVVCLVQKGVMKFGIDFSTKDFGTRDSKDSDLTDVHVPIGTFGSKKNLSLTRQLDCGYWEGSSSSIFEIVYGVYVLQTIKLS
jgi:hypothetical protein